MTENLMGEGGGFRPQVKEVQTEIAGRQLTKRMLYERCDENTALFLSGGRTPLDLYRDLASERRLKAGAVAMVDERFNSLNALFSNQRMIEDSGLAWDFEMRDIPFRTILGLMRPGMKREDVSREYDSIVRGLLAKFKKRIAILGLGVDGHIAGIAPNKGDFKNPMFSPRRQDLLVSEFEHPVPIPEGFGERITLTLKALSQMDLLIVLVFGAEKKKGIELALSKGRIEDAPGRFLMTEQMARKTILITDQKV